MNDEVGAPELEPAPEAEPEEARAPVDSAAAIAVVVLSEEPPLLLPLPLVLMTNGLYLHQPGGGAPVQDGMALSMDDGRLWRKVGMAVPWVQGGQMLGGESMIMLLGRMSG